MEPAPQPIEKRVPVKITETGQFGTVPVSEFEARRGTGYYTPVSRDEYKRAKFVASTTDNPLEKARATAETVGASLGMGLPDLAAAKFLDDESFEEYQARRDWGDRKGIGTLTDLATAVTGVGALGKAVVGQTVKGAVKQGIKAEVKKGVRGAVKEGAEELAELEAKQLAKEGAEQVATQSTDDALLAIAQEAGDTPLGRSLTKRLLGGAAKVAEFSPTGLAVKGAVKAGEAAGAAAGRVGLGAGAQAATRLGVEGASEAALYQIKENISEASLGNEELTAERLFAGTGEAALTGGAFGGALGLGAGTLEKAFSKAKHLVPDASAIDDLNLGGDVAEKGKQWLLEKSARMSGETVEDLERAFRKDVRGDHLHQTAVREDMANRFRQAWDDAHSVDAVQRSLLAGELKAQNVAKTVKRGPETLGAADRMMTESTKGLLSKSPFLSKQAVEAFGAKELKGLRTIAETAQGRMAAALKKGDEAQANLALENLKRDLDAKSKAAQQLLARGGAKSTLQSEQLVRLAEYAEEEAHRVRRFLEDEEVWGLAGKNQRDRNAAFHEMLGPASDVKNRFVTRLREGAEDMPFAPNTYGTRKIEYADQKKIQSYLGEIQDTGRDVIHDQTRRYFDSREKWLSTVIESGELPVELAKDFKTALEATRKARATINEASERVANINLLDGILKREQERSGAGLGLLGSTAVTAFAGGPKAAAMNALDHLAKGTISRPGSIAHRLAVIDGMADRASQVERGMQSRIGGFVKGATKVAKAGAEAVGRGVARAGRAGRSAAVPAYIEAYGEDAEKRQQKIEKRLDRLFEMHADPQLSLRYAGHITRGMGDTAPAVTAAAVAKHRTALDYITSRVRPMGSVTASLLQPGLAHSGYSEQEIHQIAKMLTVIDRPLSILDDLERGTVSPVAVETLKAVWPQLYDDIRQKVIQEVGKQKEPLSIDATIQLSLLLDLPGRPSMTPEFMQRQAGRYAQQPQQSAQPPQAPTGGPAPRVGENSATLSESIAANL